MNFKRMNSYIYLFYLCKVSRRISMNQLMMMTLLLVVNLDKCINISLSSLLSAHLFSLKSNDINEQIYMHIRIIFCAFCAMNNLNGI